MTVRHAVGDWNVALVGAATLQGKEIKAVLEERGFPRRRLALMDDEEAQGQLTEFDGEPAIAQPLDPDMFQGFDLAIFASSPSFTRQHWRSAVESGCRIIDLSGALEDESGAMLCSPFVDSLWGKSDGESEDRQREHAAGRSITISPDPAAMAIAGILALLSRRARILRAAITLHEPVSGHGQGGVEELHRQTISLLSFQQMPKAVFDVQVAFNMLSRYGAQAQPTLLQGRQRIVRHIEALRAGRAIQPAVRSLQAPVFHGYSLSCWVEMDQPLSEAEIETALDQKPFLVRREPDPQPDLVTAAGQDEFILGAVERDAANQAGYWIWGAFDHLRVAALNTVLVAERMVLAAAGETSARS
jgi:aspartate-semialdehyde dehydrogenase